MVANISDATVTLSWTPPATSSGIITHYQIQYRKSDNSSSSSNTFTILNTTSPDLVYTVTGLTSDAEYVFRVRAYTVVGHGPLSNEVVALTSKLCTV